MRKSKTKKTSQLKIQTKKKTKKENEIQAIDEKNKTTKVHDQMKALKKKIYCFKNLKHSFDVFNKNNKSKIQNSKS